MGRGHIPILWGFPGGSVVKDPPAAQEAWVRRSPGEGNGHPLQYSSLGSPMDKGAWWAPDHRVTKSQTRLSIHAYTDTQTDTHTCTHTDIYVHAYTHRDTYIHAHPRVHIDIQRHTHTYMHIHTDTHIHIHAYTHTDTHTLIPYTSQQTCLLSPREAAGLEWVPGAEGTSWSEVGCVFGATMWCWFFVCPGGLKRSGSRGFPTCILTIRLTLWNVQGSLCVELTRPSRRPGAVWLPL